MLSFWHYHNVGTWITQSCSVENKLMCVTSPSLTTEFSNFQVLMPWPKFETQLDVSYYRLLELSALSHIGNTSSIYR